MSLNASILAVLLRCMRAKNYFFDEVLALRVIEDTDAEGNPVQARWLQTRIGQGYVA